VVVARAVRRMEGTDAPGPRPADALFLRPERFFVRYAPPGAD
jgi:hypothetical protein